MKSHDPVVNEKLSQVLALLGEAKEIVLSTCSEGRVTSRLVSCACNGCMVLFLSWKHHTKCQQIKTNPSVALCYKNLQIEGRAEMIGNPLDEANKAIVETFKKIQPEIFKHFSPLPGMTLVKISLTAITTWTRDAQGYRIDHFDLEKNSFQSVRPTEEYTW